MSKKIVFSLSGLAIFIFAVALTNSFLNTKSNRSERVKAANLVVYTHSSFMDAYGPGSELKSEFEKTCDCTIEYIDAGGAAAAIERVRLDPSRRVDVIMGIDHLLLARLAQNIKVQAIPAIDVKWSEAIRPFVYARFIPYDWSPMGFIYRKDETQPATSWSEAIANFSKNSISLQDPSMSAPGLEFLYWLFVLNNDFSKILKEINPFVHSYSPSWSASYGLFKNKQAKITFSYLTSLIYHWSEEKNENYQFMNFAEGHPAQIEYAVVPEVCWNCGTAKKFVEFLLTPSAQKILAEKNFMLPILDNLPLSEAYARLPQVKILSPEKLEEFARRQSELLEMWRLSRSAHD